MTGLKYVRRSTAADSICDTGKAVHCRCQAMLLGIMFIQKTERKIMWGDLDSMGIVFHPRYSEWFDGCSNNFFESIGLTMERLRGRNKLLFGLVDISVEYYHPGRYNQDIVISTSIRKLSDKIIGMQHLLHSKGEGRLMVKGMENRICMDLSDPNEIRARKMPDDIYDVLYTAFSGS